MTNKAMDEQRDAICPSDINDIQVTDATTTMKTPRSSGSSLAGPASSTIKLQDHELCTKSQQARDQVKEIMSQLPVENNASKWKLKYKREAFNFYNARTEAGDYSILAHGKITCSLEELLHLLHSENEEEFNTCMTSIYGKEFIFGSIVHAAKSHVTIETQVDLFVKSATFSNTTMFSKNEQLCFLDSFERKSGERACTQTWISLNPEDLLVGTVRKTHVDHLHDLLGAYSFEEIEEGKYTQLTFYGHFHPGATGTTGASMLKSKNEARLKRMAKACCLFPKIIQRRRLGFQTLMDTSHLACRNTHCNSCTKPLNVLKRKKPCDLCGFFTCEKCSTMQEIERRRGKISRIRTCERCLDSVDKCVFKHVKPEELGPANLKPSMITNPQPQQSYDQTSKCPSPPSSSSSTTSTTTEASKLLAHLLSDALAGATTKENKQAVVNVINHLLRHSKDVDKECESWNPHLPFLTLENADEQHMAAFKSHLKLQDLSVESCPLSENSGRNYPLQMPDFHTNSKGTPNFPLPENEELRLAAIQRDKLLELGDLEELNVLCTIAAKMLGCGTGLLTVVTAKNQYVIASNSSPLQKVVFDRDQAVCSYLIMNERLPLLLPHLEADARFGNYWIVQDLHTSFYLGFPVATSDDTVVGAMCCLDEQTQSVSTAQYSVMKKLSQVASSLLQQKVKDKVLHEHLPEVLEEECTVESPRTNTTLLSTSIF